MKRCPECRRDYYDDSLLYCLDDGAHLLEGPGSDRTAAAIASIHLEQSESPTVRQILSTDETAVIPTRVETGPSRRSNGLTDGPRRVSRRVVTVLITLIIFIGIVFGIYKLIGSQRSTTSAQVLKIERVTTNGKTSDVAISPDGKFVVYVVDKDGQQSVWTQQVATKSNVQIIPPAHVNYRGLGFSPDGNYVNFVREEKNDVPPVLYQIPALGGVEKRLISNIYGSISYSPDGKQIAFLRPRFPSTEEGSLLLANLDGSEERILVSIKRPDVFPTSANQSPSWSADGKSIAAIVRNISSSKPSIGEVQVADGSLKTITGPDMKDIQRLAWLPDKSGLLLLGTDTAFVQPIWLVQYPGGEARKITTDLNIYFGMSLTADARTLVTVQETAISNIWVAPSGDPGNAVQIKSGGSNYDGVAGLAWTPDGRIVYQSTAGGSSDIWIMNSDGGGQKRLTTEGINLRAKVTPDGRYIVFECINKGEQNIWRIDMNGGNLVKLTRGNSDEFASVTPDSRWVIYTSKSSGDWRLWRVSIDGGEAAPLLEKAVRYALVSPDGESIFCEYGEGDGSRWRKAIIPFEGEPTVKFLDIPSFARINRWSNDSRSITYLGSQGGFVNLWTFPLDGTPPKQITNFKTDETFDFDWSPQGALVLARGPVTSDVVLISNFR